MPSRNNKFRIFISIVIVSALVAAGYYFYAERSATKQGIPEFTTTTVGKGDITQLVTATGQLNAVLSVDVGSQISGQIKSLYVDFNSPVKQGQKLAEIDPATYLQRVRQAEADLSSAQASANLATLNSHRTSELFEKSLVTQQENDQAQMQLQQANATLLTRQAALDNIKVDLARCTIYSPIDGIVISKQTEVGKTVAASMNVPVLFTIANDLAKMQITAAVAEADIGQVDNGQAVTFTVDAFPNRTFNGEVTQVRNAPKTTNNVVTYETIINVENRDLKLRPGMTANVSIVVSKRTGTIRLANAALRVRLPEGFTVTPAKTETPAGKTDAAPAAPPPPAAGNGREGMRRFFGPGAPPEVREKMRAIMAEVGFTPGAGGPPSTEQREQMRKLMIERGLISAEAKPSDSPYTTRTVYRLPGGNKAATPEAVNVQVGITDGIASEIAGGLAEGDVILTSITVAGAKPGAAPANNPFGGQRRF